MVEFECNKHAYRCAELKVNEGGVYYHCQVQTLSPQKAAYFDDLVY